MIRHSTANRIFQILPFQESLTYFQRTNADEFMSYSITRAHRQKVDKNDKEIALEILLVTDLVWLFPCTDLPITPANDDYFIDESGTQWIIQEVTQQINGSIYKVYTRKAVK